MYENSKYKFEENEMLQIYINKSEQKDLKIIQEINELKKHYSNITMFISGENKTIKTIKEMMNYEKVKIRDKRIVFVIKRR